MTDTANLGLPCIEGSQAQKHVTHNEALRILDTLVQLAVLDRDLTAPPGSPTEGQRWIVKSDATGAWAGRDNAIAAWQDGAWQFCPPQVGWLAYVMDEGALLAWDGAAWASAIEALTPTALNNMTLLGVGTTADATNPFSAKLNNTLFTAKTAAEGGDGDLRYKMSKEAAANTLSLLFQDNFSGRAEIGLTGDDDFRFKVSPDGTTWRDAILIDRNTGQVSFPQGGGASTDLDLTLAQLTLGVADALNTAQFVGASGNRFADSFDALDYVDTGGATNLDAGTAGALKPSAAAGAKITTDITYDTDGSVNTGAFHDGSAGENRASATRANDNTILNVGAHFSSPTPIGGYKLWGASDEGLWQAGGRSSGDLLLYGSDAGFKDAGKTLLDTVNVTDAAGIQVDRSIVGPFNYRYYWVEIPAGGAAKDESCAEFELWSLGSTNNVVVTSTALPAASQPSSAKLVARVKEVDSIALNTDLIFSVSRDGGATWSAFTMTKKFAANSISVYESGLLDISGQPSGTSVKWKAASANNKNFELTDIHLYWS